VFAVVQDPTELQYDWELDKTRYIELLRAYDGHRDVADLAVSSVWNRSSHNPATPGSRYALDPRHHGMSSFAGIFVHSRRSAANPPELYKELVTARMPKSHFRRTRVGRPAMRRMRPEVWRWIPPPICRSDRTAS